MPWNIVIINILHNYPFFLDAKTSDQRLTIPYLFQELCEKYDEQGEDLKKELEIASHTGFQDRKFLYDRCNQLSIETMQWLDPSNFGTCSSLNLTNIKY